MAFLQPVRGTRDLLPEGMRLHQKVVETARDVVRRYGFEEVATPILEFAEVFARTLGDAADIVTKEMYAFERSGKLLALRPENTAGICRAFLSNGLVQQLPFKAFYAGPMFRYERPQEGRQRQFHQAGVELLGVASPLGDVEVLAAAVHVLDALGLQGRTALELNSLGDGASRAAYREKLVAFLSRFKNDLSEDSRLRLERNPLRILDSKDENDRRIIADAPVLTASLNAESRAFFDAVCAGLADLGIACRINPMLVRGLDYYSHTAFEFVADDLGAQGAVLSGGRYDGLIETMGGPATPGIGWAAGVERLSKLMADLPAKERPIALVPIGEEAERAVLPVAERLRRAGFAVDMAYGGSLKKRMARANGVRARAAVIVGEDEMRQGEATIRDLDAGVQQRAALDGLEGALERFCERLSGAA